MATKKDTKAAQAVEETPVNKERLQALDRALSALDKQFGKGTVMRLGSHAKMAIDVIPSGNLALDLAMGVGGVPRHHRGLWPRVLG